MFALRLDFRKWEGGIRNMEYGIRGVAQKVFGAGNILKKESKMMNRIIPLRVQVHKPYAFCSQNESHAKAPSRKVVHIEVLMR